MSTVRTPQLRVVSQPNYPYAAPLPLSQPVESPKPVFTQGEREALAALGRATMPATAGLPASGVGTVDKLAAFLALTPRPFALAYKGLLSTVSTFARVLTGRSLSQLSDEEVRSVCLSFHQGGFLRRQSLRSLLTPLKIAYFDDPHLFARLGALYRVDAPKGPLDEPRYISERTLLAADIPNGEVLHCDVLVIGSGAGGAVAARELAEAGHAVLILEEGLYYKRNDFSGRPIEMQRKLYRDMGGTVAMGNTVIPVPVGRSVGGTTTINSGTCYRMPGRILRKWHTEFGLTDLTESEMDAAYERVEGVLQVKKADAAYLGGVAHVIARGCDALGYKHGPLLRNAPGCDGQGVCCFGCPTDAKRSTNVSYIPLALRAGAQILTGDGARAVEILLEGGRAVGVKTQGGFTVRCNAVVVAGGALMTPVLLLGDPKIKAALSRSGQLGRNLTIHPAMPVFALMKEPIHGYNAIPQGYAIEEFHDEGLLMEGVFAPLDFGAASVIGFGPRFMELMAAYDRMASFGFLLEEESRGQVRRGPKGRPLITYFLKDSDVARIKRGVEILMRVYFAGGAEAVLPQIDGFEELRSPDEIRLFRRANLRARDFPLTAYHPLGTARMGRDPASSLVNSLGEVHDVPGLYICDGSILPSSPAVNPQLTIMALATRISRHLAERL